VRFLFPALGKGEGEAGRWTHDHLWETAQWVAEGLRIMHEEGPGHTSGEVIYRVDEDGVERPVAYCRYVFEFGREAKEAKKNSFLALTRYEERSLALEDMEWPSTLDLAGWLAIIDSLNEERAMQYARAGLEDILICRESTPILLIASPFSLKRLAGEYLGGLRGSLIH
jgi:hypothetical protein